MKLLFIGLIRLYQLTISKLFGPSCRFYPSCSDYTKDAISRYGVARGSLLGIRRILKCHPFSPGGIDYLK